MKKIYNEIVIDMNPESDTYKETLYEDSYIEKGEIALCKGATWRPSKGSWGWFGYDRTGNDSVAARRYDKYGTHDRSEQGIIQQGWDVIDSGVEGMTKQTEQYMGIEANAGPDGIVGTSDDIQGVEGILDKKARLKTEGLDLKEQRTQLGLDEQLSKVQTAGYGMQAQADQALSKGGFATSGEVQTNIEMQKQSLVNQGQTAWAGTGIAMQDIGIQREEISVQLDQDKADFMKKVKDDYNNLLMSYQSATGEAYDKGTDIDNLLDEYDS